MYTDTQLNQMARSLGEVLLTQSQTLVAAESCTGGWIAKVVTDVAGSSAWFDCGLATYSNEAKQALLGVRAETLAAHGAVSEACAVEMAAGALMRSGAGMAVAVTGIAGPTGASEDKPVGTVWIAWQRRREAPISRLFHFSGDRESVRRQTVASALEGLLKILTS